MHRKTAPYLTLSFFLLLTACSQPLKQDELPSNIQIGKTYYTQFSLFQEENNFRTTNYRRGNLIPINTPVTLISISNKDVHLSVNKTGQPLRIENVPEFTIDTMQTAFLKILAPHQVDLNGFPQSEQKNILAGEVEKGMDRKAVLAAIGYPPQHKTPRLSANDWVYWSSRLFNFTVHFNNGKVEKIVNNN